MNHHTAARQRGMASPDSVLRFVVLAVLVLVFTAGIFHRWYGTDLVDHLPTVTLCPFHAITGYPCPGCGMTRAMVCVGQLRFGEAIAFNPFSIPLTMIMIVYLCLGRTPTFLQNEVLTRLILLAVIIFWIHRLMNA
jgi:hypothetical protein